MALSRLTPGKTTAFALTATNQGDHQNDVSLSFPFNAPGYRVEPVAGGTGTSFDVVRCPIADYFRKQGTIDLCSASWCGLDYAFAELTHQKLVRTKTLVRGDDRCDFRLNESPGQQVAVDAHPQAFNPSAWDQSSTPGC